MQSKNHSGNNNNNNQRKDQGSNKDEMQGSNKGNRSDLRVRELWVGNLPESITE